MLNVVVSYKINGDEIYSKSKLFRDIDINQDSKHFEQWTRTIGGNFTKKVKKILRHLN
jgi:hypothetical protein